jgi:RimJ/RimL family protein N-acetyltransferase
VLADVREQKLTDKVLAITSIDNHKSIRLVKKLGFSFKGLKWLSENNSGELELFELEIQL